MPVGLLLPGGSLGFSSPFSRETVIFPEAMKTCKLPLCLDTEIYHGLLLEACHFPTHTHTCVCCRFIPQPQEQSNFVYIHLVNSELSLLPHSDQTRKNSFLKSQKSGQVREITFSIGKALLWLLLTFTESACPAVGPDGKPAGSSFLSLTFQRLGSRSTRASIPGLMQALVTFSPCRNVHFQCIRFQAYSDVQRIISLSCVLQKIFQVSLKFLSFQIFKK